MIRRSAYLRSPVTIGEIATKGGKVCRRLLAMCWPSTPAFMLLRLRPVAMSFDTTRGERTSSADIMMDLVHRDFRREYGSSSPYLSVTLTLSESRDSTLQTVPGVSGGTIHVKNSADTCRVMADSLPDAVLLMYLMTGLSKAEMERIGVTYAQTPAGKRTAMLREMVRRLQ